MNKLLLFDFDGVLADTMDNIISNAVLASEIMGIETTPAKEIVRTLEKMEFEEFASKIGVPYEKNAEFVETILSVFSSQKKMPGIFNGIPEVLSMLSSNTIYIVTGNSESIVEKFCNQYDISKYIQKIYDKKYSSSKEIKINAAIESSKISNDNAYMIGDAVSDIKAAQTAGITSIAAAWGNQDIQLLRNANPDFIVNTPNEIIDIIER